MEKVGIDIKNVTTSYGKFKIKNISFSLKNGDILGLIGRSGSGKSTVMKTILGLKRPDSGKIKPTLDGKEVSLKELISYSPQDNSLYPFLSIEENLFTFGQLHKMKKKEILSRSNILLKRLDLINSRKKKITELSGGMQKRADLAVTLLNNPKVIVLDEPFTGLDVSLQKFIWDLLIELKKQGRIIIITSHMLHEIQTNCNHFGLVENGYYYNTNQIKSSIKRSKKSLESFLEKLFNKDLKMG